MSTLPFTRLFSMSAFEGLRSLRRYQPLHPQLALGDLANLVASVDADATGLDFEGAVALHGLVSADASIDDGPVFYRACIEALILNQQPIWAKIMTLGRKKLIQNVSRDEAQCFRGADLLAEPVSMAVIQWLDQIVGRVRLELDAAKLARARQAENLTMQHEASRLKNLGINRQPKWVAIDDNTVGYDVLSFDPGAVEPTARLIEVKSTVVSPLRFILTRNEWKQAAKYGPSYHFHIWHLAPGPPRLFERTVIDIAPHIPSDNERGRWRNAEIPL